MRASGEVERLAPPEDPASREPARAAPAGPAVSLEGVWKAFTGAPVLRGLDFEVPRRNTVTVMGGSGSGKTVLLRLAAGLIKPDRGRIETLGVDITPLREEALLPVRRRMGFVFQSAALFDSLTVYENVAYPLREHARLAEDEIRRRVVHFLSLVGLDDNVLRQLPAELSGGMRKRVGIARALIAEPEVMLYDEPTAGLDPTNSKMVGELIVRMGEGVCDSSIVVTHDLELTKTVADRVAVLVDGRFAAAGTVDEVLAARDDAVQAFLAGKAKR